MGRADDVSVDVRRDGGSERTQSNCRRDMERGADAGVAQSKELVPDVRREYDRAEHPGE